MNFIRTPLFVHITDIHKQITEHERLILVLKDKTASFSFRTLDIGTFFFAKRACSSDISDNELVASFDEKRRYFLKYFTDYLLQMDGSDLSKGFSIPSSRCFWIGLINKRKFLIYPIRTA